MADAGLRRWGSAETARTDAAPATSVSAGTIFTADEGALLTEVCGDAARQAKTESSSNDALAPRAGYGGWLGTQIRRGRA